jgi:ABC-type branched-subunit amino acid transport system substrate-binding protein
MTILNRPSRLMVIPLVALLAAACTTAGTTAPPAATSDPGEPTAPPTSAEPGPTGDILLGHMTYRTGEFADVGPWFEAVTELPLSVINEDPPLGRPIVAIHEDIGTIGEAAAARKLIESDGVEILFGPAHGYLSYRDFALDQVATNDGPLMPSVHGGSIEAQYGGTVEEPIMRASPQDSGQASAALLYAQELGAQNIVIVATELAGSQLQKTAALSAAEQLGLNVVLELDIASLQPSYRDVINRIAGVEQDAVFIASQAQDGGTFVKQAAEGGNSWTIMGTSEWLGDAFAAAATIEAIDQHEAVVITGFSYADGPAFDFYAPLYEAAAAGNEALENLPPENPYNIQYWDSIMVTALAIEQAGSTNVSDWVPAMREVAMAPGESCATYPECLALIRAGTDVDYSGITGEVDWTDTGVVSGIFGVFEWTSLTTLEQVTVLDGTAVFELESGQ